MNSYSPSFRNKVLDPKQNIIMYETVPPKLGTPDDEMYKIAEKLAVRIKGIHIDAINIPEVRDENNRNGRPRPFPYVPITEPRIYGKILSETAGLEHIERIINTVVVHYPHLEQWLYETWNDFSVRNLVLVGGESSSVQYPGPSVTEVAELVRRSNLDYFLGGITIPERHIRKGDEPRRIIRKSRRGIRFFTSQVIYDPKHTVKLFSDYSQECERNEEEPARIFLSFSPFSTKREADFLEWLGAEIPYATRAIIRLLGVYDIVVSSKLLRWLDLDPLAARKSAQICRDNLKYILDHAINLKPRVPIGLNVENVSRKKIVIDTSVEMLGMLSKELEQFYKVSV